MTLYRIRPGTAVGAPKSEPPAYASGSSVSGQLLVMCVLGACGVAGNVYGSCACEMGLLDALIWPGRPEVNAGGRCGLPRFVICAQCESDKL
eukprot:scaffold7517_cov64-Phaeocystis_antarctica.AAC.3